MILYELKKKWAKTSIVFEENLTMDSDKWFININYINKSGDIKDSKIIIRKDISIWLNKFKNDGWEIETISKKNLPFCPIVK